MTYAWFLVPALTASHQWGRWMLYSHLRCCSCLSTHSNPALDKWINTSASHYVRPSDLSCYTKLPLLWNPETLRIHCISHYSPSALNLQVSSQLKVKVAQSYLTLRPHGLYTVQGILQASKRERVAIPFPRGSSQPRDWIQVSCIAGGIFTSWSSQLDF